MPSADGEDYARLNLPVNDFQPAGNGGSPGVGRDPGVPVTQYRTPHGRIEGDVRT
ncbi:MAG: hypothetical protein P8Y58_00385 [Novosphingobium sp.]